MKSRVSARLAKTSGIPSPVKAAAPAQGSAGAAVPRPAAAAVQRPGPGKPIGNPEQPPTISEDGPVATAVQGSDLPSTSFEVGAGASAAEASEQPRARPELAPRMSIMSLQVVDGLDDIAQEIYLMAQSCDEAEKHLSKSSTDEMPHGLRNELAQLHGNANKLLATKLDAILTGELNSGRDCARAKRKALIKTTESLIERVEVFVKQFDSLKKEEEQQRKKT